MIKKINKFSFNVENSHTFSDNDSSNRQSDSIKLPAGALMQGRTHSQHYLGHSFACIYPNINRPECESDCGVLWSLQFAGTIPAGHHRSPRARKYGRK